LQPEVQRAQLERCTRAPRKRHTWKLSIAYYGPAFSGMAWQRTPPKPTVSGCLHAAIEPLLLGRHSLRLGQSGRTDAGVSALGQRISFYAWPELDVAELEHAIAEAAPEPGALRLVSAEQTTDRSYHASFSTRWRRYAYFLPPPIGHSREDVMREAAAIDALLQPLVGEERQYAALGRGLPKGKSVATTLLHARARVVELPGGTPGGLATRVDLVGDRFIRRQVRTLVASAVHVANTLEGEIAEELNSPSASQRSTSAAMSEAAVTTALLRIATSGVQQETAHPAPALGLVFAEAGAAPFDGYR